MQVHSYGALDKPRKLEAPASNCFCLRVRKPLRSTTALWSRLEQARGAVLRSVEAALKAESLPALAWYDALLEIGRAGPDGIRPYVLKERLLLPQYSMSRLLDRMEAFGAIERSDAPSDRRGQVVRLTVSGASLRDRMWPVYAAALVQAVELRLDPREAIALARGLGALAAPSGDKPQADEGD